MWKYIALSASMLLGWILCALFSANKEKHSAICRWYYDYHLAEDLDDLSRALYEINEAGYHLISVSQDPSGMYTIFFGRPDT